MEKATCKKSCKSEIKTCKATAVKDITSSAKALFFSTADGVALRLTFEGVNGWRLKSARNGDFDHLGAAQSLAKYMNEEIKDCAQKISVDAQKDAVIVTEKKGTQAILSLGKAFSLRFCTKEGKVVSELTYVGFDGDGQLVLKGALAEGEAIYGGGERLDVSNKRGTVMRQRTCDGWNDSSTTYTVIPLYLTTRGGGMFLNRYEIGTVDFGATDKDVWSYTLDDSDVLDMYFYATGAMADALQGYTALAGHAWMPTPWMQEMHLCRYCPDLTTFDHDDKYEKLTDHPNWEEFYIQVGEEYVSVKDADAETLEAAVKFYTKDENGYRMRREKNDAGEFYYAGPGNCPGGISVKTITENFIKADMKPAAISMEPRYWTQAFHDSDKGRAQMADLKKSCEWLHAHGMKAMVYIAVGTVDTNDIGFKDEYLVHADLTLTNPDGTVEVRKDIVDIPWLIGTGTNPDAYCGADGNFISMNYLDITNEEACEWYFDKIWGKMIEVGVDGVKIDFCEELANEGQQFGRCKLNYHWKNPEKIEGAAIHHAYPAYYISAFYKRMIEHKAAKGLKDGFMVFSRGGGIGSQRNPYMWAGDQCRTFDKLADQLMAVVNSGISGIPFMSFDMAGYHYYGEDYHTTNYALENELFSRAVAFTSFFTQMQTHGDVRHAYEMTEETKQIYRNFTRLHTELMPYIQKYSKIACETGMPPVRHLVLKASDDENVYSINDEFMLGDALLVAPILTQNTFARDVYLPAGSWTNLLTGEVIEGGKTVSVAANLGQIPVFLDNASADVSELLPILEGQNWQQIKNWK